MKKIISLWYMRDNHTFRELKQKSAIEDALEEFDLGFNHGMLCAFINERHYDPVVHANGKEKRLEFIDEGKKWMDTLFSNKKEEK